MIQWKALGSMHAPAAPAQQTVTVDSITDATAVGKAVVKAVDATAARAAIGAGTSSLGLGTSPSTAKAGDWKPASADVTDSTATGRAVLTAANQAAARTAVGAVEAAGITKIQVITQAAYDALGAKDATTLYVITG